MPKYPAGYPEVSYYIRPETWYNGSLISASASTGLTSIFIIIKVNYDIV